MKNRTVILVLTLALALGCAWLPKKATISSPVATNTPISDRRAGEIPPQVGVSAPVPTAAMELQCVMTSAETAQHVRSGPGESLPVRGYILPGETWRLIGPAAGDWWRVQCDEVRGYARALYLQRAECPEGSK
jgi:uncharacterized protein YgiM (DUF1202 family)